MKNLYLVLAILGTALPLYFFLQPGGLPQADVRGAVALAFANPIAAGFAADVIVSSIVFWIFMFAAADDAPRPWPFILLNCLVGLSAALPAYLFWQKRRAAGVPRHASPRK